MPAKVVTRPVRQLAGRVPIGIWTLVIKVAIVLIPSYTAAWLTGQMVFTVPTLAAAAMVAAQVDLSGSGDDDDDNRRIDEIEDGPGGDGAA